MKSIFILFFATITYPIFAQNFHYSSLNKNWVIQNGIKKLKITAYYPNKNGKIKGKGLSDNYIYDERGIEHSSNMTLVKLTDSIMIEYRLSKTGQTIDTIYTSTYFDAKGKIYRNESRDKINHYFYDINDKLHKIISENTNQGNISVDYIECVYDSDNKLIRIIEKTAYGTLAKNKLEVEPSDFYKIHLYDYVYDIHGKLSEEIMYKGKSLNDLKKYRRAKYYSFEEGLLWKVYYSNINEIKELTDFIKEYEFVKAVHNKH